MIRGVASILNQTPEHKLLVFITGGLGTYGGEGGNKNFLIDAILPETVDGLIISGALTHDSNKEELEQLCQRLSEIPVISTAVPILDTPVIKNRNRPGFAALMDHLLDDHRYRSFIFVSGPHGQGEAELRKGIFLEKLEARGLTPLSLIQGNYNREAGYAGIKDFYEQKGTLPEVIVASNDSMAIGVLEFLTSIGKQKEVGVTGFDDIEESVYLDPPLTTVRQSPYNQVRQATRWILKRWKGDTQVSPETEDSQCVIRQSCGCKTIKEIQERTNTGEFEDQHLRFRKEQRLLVLRRSSEAFMATFNRDQIFEVLDRDLPVIGYRECYLSIFENQSLERANLVYSWDKNGSKSLPENGIPFDAIQLLPGGFKENTFLSPVIIISALYSQMERLGFMILGTDAEGTYLNGMIRSQLSNALQAAKFITTQKAREEALEYTNRKLQDTQRQLVETEKMAALGNLVAGISHEINTPLGVALTGTSHVVYSFQELKKLIQGDTIRKSELNRIVTGLLEAFSVIQSNLERTAALVQSFKRVSADQSQEQIQEVVLKAYLEDIILCMSPELKAKKIVVSVRGDEKTRLLTFPGAIAQIFTNLIMNSLQHGFDSSFLKENPDRQNSVTITLENTKSTVKLVYEDNGRGIDPEYLTQIFDPFFTTKRGGGGTGLGLHIVYNLVNHLLQGSLNCWSVPYEQTKFEILLPKKIVKKGRDGTGTR